MTTTRTSLLALLVVIAGVCAAITYARLTSARQAALAAEADESQCVQDLVALSSAGATHASASTAPSATQLDRLLNESATGAGTTLSSIEPGAAGRSDAGSDFVETAVFLRLEALTLRQLVAFLQNVHQREPAARAKQIELGDPQISSGDSDLWAADVTINYKSAASAKPR